MVKNNAMNSTIRVYITERCNAKCKNCFNASERSKSSMDISHFKELCAYFNGNDIQTMKIMGGEPTLHPDFMEMMEIAQYYFINVLLFTNAINNRILSFRPRDTDAVIYNFKFSKFLNKEKILLNGKGRRSLEIQITKDLNSNILLDEIKRISKDISEIIINPCFTLDCTTNIFKDRSLLLKKYEELWLDCEKYRVQLGQDHLIPLCFLLNSKIPMPSAGCICNDYCSGLIDSSYNIRFCNQYSDKLGNIYQNGKIIEYDNFLRLLSQKKRYLQQNITKKICGKCPFYNQYCNGGCFIGKKIIDSNSILDNTNIGKYFNNASNECR